MKFNVSKCKVVHYGKGSVGFQYRMAGQAVEEAESEKDLGIIFTSDMKVAAQCREAYVKANRILGLISKTVKFRNPNILLNLYKSMVRPHLEYCSVVWSPYFSKDRVLLEKVQHRFTRLFPDLKKLPYDCRLKQLGLWSLEERRNRADLIEIFKMVKGFSATDWTAFFMPVTDSVTRGHNWKLKKKHSHSNVRHYFFSQRSINRWNSLSQEDIDAPSVNAFKSRLERRRKWQMDYFKD